MSEWWDKVRQGDMTETWGIGFSEPVCRVLHRIARSGETQENLDALEQLFRRLPDGMPGGARKIRAGIPLYKLVVGQYRVTLAMRQGQLCVERITHLPEESAPSGSN